MNNHNHHGWLAKLIHYITFLLPDLIKQTLSKTYQTEKSIIVGLELVTGDRLESQDSFIHGILKKDHFLREKKCAFIKETIIFIISEMFYLLS